MSEFKDRLPQNVGKYSTKAALAVSSLLMFGGTLIQTRPINAESQGKNTPNQDNPHSLYLDNPGLVQQAIENARLNIPRVDSLLGSNLAYAQNEACVSPIDYPYSPVLCFRDSLGRQRFWGVENIGPIGRVDDYDGRNYIGSFYLDRTNYPSGRAMIDSLVFNQLRDVVYMSVFREVRGGSYQLDSGEVVSDPNDPGNLSRRLRITSSGIGHIETSGSASLSLVTEASGQALIKDASNALNPELRGRYRVALANDGIHTIGDWTRLIIPTVIPSPTLVVIRASRFEIQNPATITWQDGNMEDDYLALRAGSRGVQPAPGRNPLPKDSTSYTDPAPSPNEPCYVIVARRAGVIIANSDLFCVLLGIQSPKNAPEGFRLGLMGNIANIGLRRSALFDAYVAVAFNASGQRTLPFPSSLDSITDSITVPTCYVGAGVSRGAVTFTNGLCVFPGIASGIN